MGQKVQLTEQAIEYFFLRSKDVHIEEETAFITLFARLTKEVSVKKENGEQTEIETVWVDIDEMKLEQAPDKAQALPNGLQRYEITPEVFQNLYHISKWSPKDLFYITPYHRESTSEKFIP
ncbi:hypothetical protein ACRC6Q_08660 [Planococcus sp. SE5232]|uniref:hypothetical protein n=1 Tax=unclassified Planococcus (in: firmicutes) TaxID=2662419 RepID=UPI001CBFB91F|nr:hypothetical protein [Planococcus sp. 4-30]